MQMNKTPIDILIEKGYEDIIVFCDPDYTDALIGVTNKNQAVYDYSLMIQWLIEFEGMTEEESADFICYNDSFYYGEHYPVIYYGKLIEEELEEDPDYIPLIFTRIEDLPRKN